MALPEEFQNRMREMLGVEYEAFMASYEEPRQYGLRVNTLKISPEEFERISPFEIKKIPWVTNGYYYNEGISPAKHPYYAAGLYYLQEPSAMAPASRLPVEPGDRVLDLCAAPGGKSTELAARLRGQGLLVANDISNSRAKALLHNLELFGASNILVANETPARLAEAFAGYFDKILVDAPCSGEGMFRKAPEVAASWSLQRVDFFAGQQRAIMESAVRMLRPGGMLLYSTCTFSAEENEGTVAWALEHFSELELISLEGYEGFENGRPEWGGGSEKLRQCVRIWPHKMAGEGHFMAMFRKTEREEDKKPGSGQMEKSRGKGLKKVKGKKRENGAADPEQKKLLGDFLRDLQENIQEADRKRIDYRGGKAYLIPELPEDLKGIRFLRCGLLLGEFKKNRFEPSQPFAMALDGGKAERRIRWRPEDERVEKYLHGETVTVDLRPETAENGWYLVCVDNFSLGWGKLSKGILKNKYLCSWRKK